MGGMAEVYKARDEVLGRIDAVKVLLPQYAQDPTFAARFRQEAQAAANLSSPYIVNIYDWGQDEGSYYIVMEYIRGIDLKTAIEQHGAIDQRKVAEIASQICAGLSVAHEYDVIHRDIKPQNIMIQPDGNIKIMDFGIAKAGNTSMTATGAVLGTANYVSPEQAQGKQPTAASDLYSLGILMYEAATGRLPFIGDDAIAVALKQINEEPIPPSKINPNIDQALEMIILKALAKNPRQRFQTADQMRVCLNNYLAGKPLNIPNGMPTAVLPKTAAATAVLPASGAGKTAVLPASGGAGETKVYNRNGSGQHSGSKGGRKKKGLIIGIVIAVLALLGVGAFFLFGGDNGIPNLEGKTVKQAEVALKDAGFALGDTTEEYSETVEAGKIISQDPPASQKAEKGTKVNVVVSKGPKPPDKVEVPDLTGLTADEANKKLEKAGLVPATGDAVHDDKVEPGKVAKQSPKAGESVDEGSTVTFYLSLGAETVDVPNVLGKSEKAATSELEEAGFAVKVSQGQADENKVGTVYAQSPNGGKANKGSTVTITVYSEPEQIEVPKLDGMSVDDATHALQNKGFTLGTVWSKYSEGTGLVVEQSPKAGDKAKAGTAVDIWVDRS